MAPKDNSNSPAPSLDAWKAQVAKQISAQPNALLEGLLKKANELQKSPPASAPATPPKK